MNAMLISQSNTTIVYIVLFYSFINEMQKRHILIEKHLNHLKQLF